MNKDNNSLLNDQNLDEIVGGQLNSNAKKAIGAVCGVVGAASLATVLGLSYYKRKLPSTPRSGEFSVIDGYGSLSRDEVKWVYYDSDENRYDNEELSEKLHQQVTPRLNEYKARYDAIKSSWVPKLNRFWKCLGVRENHLPLRFDQLPGLRIERIFISNLRVNPYENVIILE